MNNDPMYNTFVKDRSQNRSKPRRVNEKDIPDFGFDIDEPAGVSKSSLGQGPAVGVDHSRGKYPDHLKNDVAPNASMGVSTGAPAGASMGSPAGAGLGGTAGVGLGGTSPSLSNPSAPFAASDAAQSSYKEPFEFEDGCISLPNPEVFNSYPPEVQRKIMEWTDRDIKARRDDASRRHDAVLRAEIARERTKTAVPVAIIVLCVVCALIIGIFVKRVSFVLGFLVVAIVVVITTAVQRRQQSKRTVTPPPPPPYTNM